MRHATTIALATALTFTAGCKKDKAAAPPPTEKTQAPATPETPPATTDTPPAPVAPASTPSAATPPATADAHAGHRHEPSDPYYCPMHPEETATEPGAQCPVCQMAMEARKK